LRDALAGRKRYANSTIARGASLARLVKLLMACFPAPSWLPSTSANARYRDRVSFADLIIISSSWGDARPTRRPARVARKRRRDSGAQSVLAIRNKL
jgi:hypothetical protein